MKFTQELSTWYGSPLAVFEALVNFEIRVTNVLWGFFSTAFCRLYKNCYKTQAHNPIELKFSTLKRALNANPSTKFCTNLSNIHGVMTDYLCKKD